MFLETMCKALPWLSPALCHTGSSVQSTKQSPSLCESALSPSWVFSHCTERFPSLQVLVLTLRAATPGDGVHTTICGASAISYFSRAATSRGPEIPVLIKSSIFYYTAQLVHADYCSFTSPGLSPHCLRYVVCQSDRARGVYGNHKPELGPVRVMCRKQMEEDKGAAGAAGAAGKGSGWKKRE